VGHVETVRKWTILSPGEIARIESEIKKLEYAREHCTDSGIGKLIDRWIEDQKMQLDSGDSQKYAAPKTPSRLPSKP
jgi:hypothetical protein